MARRRLGDARRRNGDPRRLAGGTGGIRPRHGRWHARRPARRPRRHRLRRCQLAGDPAAGTPWPAGGGPGAGLWRRRPARPATLARLRRGGAAGRRSHLRRDDRAGRPELSPERRIRRRDRAVADRHLRRRGADRLADHDGAGAHRRCRLDLHRHGRPRGHAPLAGAGAGYRRRGHRDGDRLAQRPPAVGARLHLLGRDRHRRLQRSLQLVLHRLRRAGRLGRPGAICARRGAGEPWQ